MVEKRILNLENYNHNLANHMISILNSINDNIFPLIGMLKARGLLDENEEKDRRRARIEEDVPNDSMFTSMDQDAQKT